MLFAGVRRLLQILAVLMQHALSHYCGRQVSRVGWLAHRLPPTDLSNPDRLRCVFEDLGGSFIKLAQMLSMQPDILPFEYCQALYNLLDHVHPVSHVEIVRVFEEETGQRPEAAFDRFDSRPIASGSVGQVHIGWRDGLRYAVKIQRPDAEHGFARDIKLMNTLARIVRILRLTKLQWLIDPLTEFAEWTQEELDFRREARYMRMLRQNAKGNPAEVVPAVLDEFATRRVLVVEFLEGVTLMNHLRNLEAGDAAHRERLHEAGFDAHTFARNIIDNFLGDAFRYGTFHADLHPANLMILSNNTVGYVDFGITGLISRYSRENLIAMTLAYARRDIDTMCARFLAISSIDDGSDPEGFREGLKRLSESWYREDRGEPQLKTTVTMVMLSMVQLSRQTGILPQRDVIKYIRSSIAIDGLVRQFAPDFDSGQYLAVACRRYLTWHARRMLLSHDTVVNWSRASASLMRTGAVRIAGFLERAAHEQGSLSPRRQPTTREIRFMRRRQIVHLAAFITVLVWLLLHADQPAAMGVNLFTAQALVLGYAVFLLMRALLTRPSAPMAGTG